MVPSDAVLKVAFAALVGPAAVKPESRAAGACSTTPPMAVDPVAGVGAGGVDVKGAVTGLPEVSLSSPEPLGSDVHLVLESEADEQVASKVLERLPPAPGLADGQRGKTSASLFSGGLDRVAAWSAAAAIAAGVTETRRGSSADHDLQEEAKRKVVVVVGSSSSSGSSSK